VAPSIDGGFPADPASGSSSQSAHAAPSAATPAAADLASRPASVGGPVHSGASGLSSSTGAVVSPRLSSGIVAANPAAPVLDLANTPAWPSGFSFLRTPAEILAGQDLTDPAQRAQVVAEMAEAEEVRYDAVLARAAQLGIPVRIEGPGHKVSILHDIREEGPLYRNTLNINAAISTGANLIRQTAPYNLDGSGVKVGVWDGGSILNTHQEFRTNRVIKRNTSAANNDHATHVAGTIGATGVDARAKGMAPAVAIDSYDWFSDYAEMTAAGAAAAGDSSRIPVSNHSYGYNAISADMGRYEDEAVSTDSLAYNLPFYLIFWAAGNEQDELTGLGGYQSITFNGLSKNILTIGAVNDAVSGGVRSPANGTMSTFSSWGPCDDGRIKPDLVANGVTLFSTVDRSTNAYEQSGWSGTSMSSPNAAGSAVLLQQLYRTNFSGQLMRASMLKALLIHTADDLGRPGPDYQYGWGLVNVKAAADIVRAHKASLASPKMIEGNLTGTNKVQTHTFTWDGTNAIRATLSWTDPAGAVQTATNSRTRNLRNDLDLKVTSPDGTTTSLPYVMPFVGTWTTASMSNNAIRGTNTVDNVERVDIPAPSQAGTYTVTVGLQGTNNFVSSTNQIYSLVVTGGADVPTNPPPSVALTAPVDGAAVLPSTAIDLAATATDAVIGGGPGVVTKVEFLNGTTVLGEDTTAPYTLAWTPPSAGTYNLTARATDSEGATSTSAVARVTVLVGDGTPSITSFTPTSGPGGSSVVITGTNFAGIANVTFSGVPASSYTVDSATQITALVPAAATTGPVAVTTGLGTATSAALFTILQSPVVISQIYGAGGGSGALFDADYVELYNRSGSAVDLTGWSLQYASASGTSWSKVTLSGTVGAGKYFLVKLAGGSTGAALPAPDFTSTAINLSGTQGKIGLRSNTTTFTGSSPVGQTGLEDFVGYGSANAAETAPAPAPSATTAIFRAGDGATDTGNNAADFTVSTPNPRNSAFGGGSGAPVISSPLTASGTASALFTYQITASNAPTSYNAIGLPAGLSVNSTSGLISGTPTIAGTSNVTISAVNASGTDSKTLVLTINPSGGGVVTTIFSENMGTPSGNAAISVYAAGTAPATFQNKGTLTYGQGEQTSQGDVRITTPSTGYSGASGNGNVWLTTTSGAYGFSIESINAGTYSGLSLVYGYYKNSTSAHVTLSVDYWDGSAWVTIANSATSLFNESATAAQGWYLAKALPLPAGAQVNGLKIRFVKTGTLAVRIDDVKLTGTLAASPTISTSGTLSSVTTTYGAPSPTPRSFSLSGTNMTAGILVTPPAGFEVSQTAGGASGYAATQTVGAAGTIAATDVFIRLAAGTTAGSYAGNIVCSSAGATSVNVAIPSSDVRPKALTVTANDLAKPFGQTLVLGPGQSAFTSDGLVLGESIGTVTLAAAGGLAANDASGTYELTPSDAVGGTFNPSNYEIGYASGTLTVTGQSYADWSAGLGDPAPGGNVEGDAYSNLEEYFMDLDPEAPDPALAVDFEAGLLSLDYRRNKNMQGVSGRVTWHPNLIDAVGWSTNEVTDQFLSDHGTYEMRRATVPVPPEDGQRFLRLEIEAP
jgi:hypothetical protein